MTITKILIVGDDGGTNVGGSFLRAAREIKLVSEIVRTSDAYSGNFIRRSILWHFYGRKPSSYKIFEDKFLNIFFEFEPDVILTVGVCPVFSTTIKKIKKKNLFLINYLTDDPFKKNNTSKWFLEALVFYDHIFSTKTALLNDIKKINRNVTFLPFAYDPMHCYDSSFTCEATPQNLDLLFVGGGDGDRYPIINRLIDEGIKVGVIGSYWENNSKTRKITLGQMPPSKVKYFTKDSKVCLCLTRRANRDGHVMRSFEIPAMGGCALVEFTQEHLDIFGEEGDCVFYFKNSNEMVEKARLLLGNPVLRERLAQNSFNRIVHGKNTYLDRLRSMMARLIW